MTPEELMKYVPRTTVGGLAGAGASELAKVPPQILGMLGDAASYAFRYSPPGEALAAFGQEPEIGGGLRRVGDWAQRKIEEATPASVGDTYAERMVGRAGSLGGHGLAALAFPARGLAAGLSHGARALRASPMVAGAAVAGETAATGMEQLPESAQERIPDWVPPVAGLAAEAGGAWLGHKATPTLGKAVRGAVGVFTDNSARELHPLMDLVRKANVKFRGRAKRLGKDYDELLKKNPDVPTAPVKRAVAAKLEDITGVERTASVERAAKSIKDLPDVAPYKAVRRIQEGINRVYYNVTKPKERLHALRELADGMNDGLDDLIEMSEISTAAGDAAAKLRVTNRGWAQHMADQRDFDLTRKLMQRFNRQNPVISPGEFSKWVEKNETAIVGQFGEEHLANLYKIGPHTTKISEKLANKIGKKAMGSREALGAYSSEAAAAWVRAIGGILYKARLLRRGMKDVSGTIQAARSSMASMMSVLDPKIAAEIVESLPKGVGGAVPGRIAPVVSGVERNREVPAAPGKIEDPSRYIMAGGQ